MPRARAKPIFISYSGALSRTAAFALRRLVEATLNTDAFVAEVSVDAGERWLDAITTGLRGCRVAILCITRENIYRPWMHFEAGGAALSGARVIPFLIGVTPEEVPSPLALYEARTTSHDDLWRLIGQVRAELTPKPPEVQPASFTPAFEVFRKEVGDTDVPFARWDAVLRAEDLLETGVTHAWRQRRDATEMMLRDLRSAGQSITMIARVYLSELVKDKEFEPTVRAWAARGGGAERSIFAVAADPQDTTLMDDQFALENRRDCWTDVEDYRGHVRRQARFTERSTERALLMGLAVNEDQHAAVRLTVARTSGPLLPWCFLGIDDRIVYVSFYRRAGTATYGTNAPTLRAERPADGSGHFFDQLQVELRALRDGATVDRSRLLRAPPP